MVEHMFEYVSDADLIDVMGEATRDESTAIAQRLAAVGELTARRERDRAEWYCRIHRVHKLLTAGAMSFARTHRYGDATAKRCHSPGTPFSS